MGAHPARHTNISIEVEGSPVYREPQERQSKPIVTDQRRRTHFNTETEPDGGFMNVKSTMHVDDRTFSIVQESVCGMLAFKEDSHFDALIKQA